MAAGKQAAPFRFKRHDEVGAAGAEEDAEFLSACFVDTGDLKLLESPHDKRVIVLGRTGSGKTALLLELQEQRDNVIALVPENLALSYLSNSTILKFFDSLGVNLDPFFKLLWRHVLTVEILNRYFSDHPSKQEETLINRLRNLFPGKSVKEKGAQEAIDYLTQWGEKFWQETEYRVREITEKVENDLEAAAQAGINLTIGELSATGTASHRLTQEQKSDLVARGQHIVSEAQVQDLSKVLGLLRTVLEDRQQVYYVTVDKLDENWVEERIRYKLIMALILTAKEFLQVKNAKIVLALRRDLIERVFRLTRDSGFQEEKYHSLYLPLEWQKSDLIDLLDRRIARLVRRTYTQAPVTHRDLLPLRIDKIKIDEYLYQRCQRPRDIISFFNTCIHAAEGKPKVHVQALRKAEGEWSRQRFRALGDEWSADYPRLLDFAMLLRGRPRSFKVKSIASEEIEGFCLDRAAEAPEGHGILQRIVLQVVDLLLEPEEARKQIIRIFYRVGLVGLKLAPHESESWVDQLGRGVSSAEIDEETSVVIHTAFHRELGVK